MKKKTIYFLIALFTLHIAANAQLTYNDVAPVFIQRCTSCHHQGKTFPYFTNYSSISLYRGLISQNLQTGKMPPWLPDTSYTRFAHEQIITQAEKDKIISWVAAGAPAGDTTLAITIPRYSNYQLNGTPDLILRVPQYISTASTTDRNVCFSLPMNLVQDRVLRAYEVAGGSTPLAHHIMINVDTLGISTTDYSGSCPVSSFGFILGGWIPGSPPIVFPGVEPVKFGITIKSGSKLVLQVHYPAGTDGLTDSTQIRLFFYPPDAEGIRNLTAVPIKNLSFHLPADSITTVFGMYPKISVLPDDISLLAISPHSHKICTSIDDYASNGLTTIPLCRINRWNFERQGFYTFRNLLKIPAGYKLYGKHIFDNTTANPYYSQLAVNSGTSSDDEMIFDGLMWAPYLQGDEEVDIKSIIENDSLFMLPGDTVMPSQPAVTMYPNPFTDKLMISYEVPSTTDVHLSIYNAMGQKMVDVLETRESGFYRYEWDTGLSEGMHKPPGIYTYQMSIGSKHYSGKMILSTED